MLSKAMNNRWLGKSFGLVPGCLLFIAALRCEAQNLVPNPSFELQDTCPFVQGFQDGSKPLYWEKWHWSPDYFNACATGTGSDSLFDVPLNGIGFQYPLDGEAYVGMSAYDPWFEYREYVGCQLSAPLEVGEPYELSFFTSPGIGGTYWGTNWACNNMGLLFTMEPNIWTSNNGPSFALRNYAHLHSEDIISDTANWTLISGSFVADSAYQYLVIGNFFSGALTDTAHLGSNTSLGAYYFVDGVCVRKAGEECEFTSGISGAHMERPLAWPNPAAEVLKIRMEAGGTWQVFDAMGRIVESGVSQGRLLTLPVRVWAHGEYVLRLGDRERKHIRFVVLR
jgi:hypothetical protein